MNIKAISLISVTALVVVYATIRVLPYMNNPRNATATKQHAGLVKSVQVIDQNYAEETLLDGATELSFSLASIVKSTLDALPVTTRPSTEDNQQIAALVSQYVLISRTGTREDMVQYYQLNGLVPPSKLIDSDIVKSNKRWASSNAWAKHKPINPENLRIEMIYKNRVSTEKPPRVFGMYRSRPFRSQSMDANSSRRLFSSYEVFVPVTVPAVNGESEYTAEIGLVVLNDGPEGQWSVLRTRFVGLPVDAICYLPFP